MRLSVLVVDDEPHARRYIKGLLAKDGDIAMVYECKNGREMLKFLKNKVPNLIFLDINMPELNGIEAAAQLEDLESLLVFSTAYDQYALRAFELRAFDYLVKPFGEARFFEVLNRAKITIERFQKAAFSEKFASVYKDYNQALSPHISEFNIKEKGFERSIATEEVLYIEASSIYAVLHLEGATVLYRAALNLLEQQLPPNFVRVHRSYMINTDFIKTTKYLNNSTYMITMINDDVIISSRRYKDRISQGL